MSNATLTSLAMLKVQIDRGADYLDYLRPFVLQALVDHKPDPITDVELQRFLREDFGLEIPQRTVQILLQRLSRKLPLRKEAGIYRITGKLPDQKLAARKAEALRHISAVTAGLAEFSKTTLKPIDETGAAAALLAFLAQFDVACIKAYLRGTALPTVAEGDEKLIPLVSSYALKLQQSDPERFQSLVVVVTGHMLANALLCPDLQDAPKSFQGLTIFLDTPLLVRLMGLEGDAKRDAVLQMVKLCQNLGATVAVFEHSASELQRVIKGASDFIDRAGGRSEIIRHARETGLARSDLLMMTGQIDQALKNADVQTIRTPQYSARFQIDEAAFEGALEDEVAYNNPRAREDDINSVRSIYALRQGVIPRNIERSKAVLVTSNAGFAKAAFVYGQNHEESREVSSVITDFSLANIAWLKAPMGAPSVPASETIAVAYAALQPSGKFLDKLFKEIEKLESRGTISPNDHQLLRSEALAHRELVQLTLGDDEALNGETITRTLTRVKGEIAKEHKAELLKEKQSHDETQRRLAQEVQEKRRVQERIYWRSRRLAKAASWTIAIIVGLSLVTGVAAGLGLASTRPVLGWIIGVSSALFIVATVVDMLIGFSVKEMRRSLEERLARWLLKRASRVTGLQLDDVQ